MAKATYHALYIFLYRYFTVGKLLQIKAGMAELADAADSKSAGA
jgi:hypothetical protein